MTKKNKSSESINVEVREGENESRQVAKVFADPKVLAGNSIKNYHKEADEVDVNSLILELSEQCQTIKDGNMERVEDMLIAQAHTLDSLFHEMLIKRDASALMSI